MREVFGLLRLDHFTVRREEFVSLFISSFLKQFREVSRIEETGIINDHPIYHYISFIEKELGIRKKEDLLDKFKKDERSLRSVFPEPELLKPTLSSKGFDTFLILKLIKENAKKHFHSFVILTFLWKRGIYFKFNYLNIYKKLETEDFRRHIKSLEKALSKFGSDLVPLDLDENLLKFLAVWWEYYQFAFIGEKITRDIHRYRLNKLSKSEIRKKIPEENLAILVQFLKNYIASRHDYTEILKKDEKGEQILLQLEEMESKTDIDSIFEYLFKKAASQSFNEYVSDPFFPSLESFERWVSELMRILKLT